MRLIKFTILALLAAFAGSAATITLADGSMSAILITPGDLSSILAMDVRSTAVFGVFDPLSLGSVATSDQGAPAPNTVLLGTNVPPSEAIGLVFATGLVNLAPDLLSFSTTLAGLPLTPITDAALSVFTQPLTYNFTLTATAPLEGGGISLSYALSSVTAPIDGAVPEPMSMALVGLGLLVVGLRSRLKRS